MTDNEIIKALKECEECHFFNDCEKSTRLALDLINRQKAEIERLQGIVCTTDKLVEKTAHLARAEAIKEFAERLKKEIGERWHYDLAGIDDTMCALTDIDELVKEMTEGKP